jgi:homoserine dehydrogenase
MIPRAHPLRGVREAYNAVFVEAEAAGELMFYGRGAGGLPTASAVLGDVVSVARTRVAGGRGRGVRYAELAVRRWASGHPLPTSASTWPTGRVCWRRWRRCSPAHGVSIETVRSNLLPTRTATSGHDRPGRHVVVTHTAPDAALAATVEALAGLDVVAAVSSVMRVEGEH